MASLYDSAVVQDMIIDGLKVRGDAGPADSMDMANRLARLSEDARRFVKDYIDAEERRMRER